MAQPKGDFLRIPVLENIVVTVLQGIYGIVGNYGIAIIIVTILVRILIFPLTLKQEKSMKKLRDLQPEVDKIKEKYKDDQQKIQQKTMELYKENNANPLSGCLPMLIQMPIFIALFYAFKGPAIPNNASFLWFNLKKPDNFFMLGNYVTNSLPNFINLLPTNFFKLNIRSFIENFAINLLPILNTGVTYLQQKMMSGATKGQEANGTMQSMMYTMPLLMLLLFYNMPSGVTLYYLVSGVLSVAQQYIIMKGRD